MLCLCDLPTSSPSRAYHLPAVFVSLPLLLPTWTVAVLWKRSGFLKLSYTLYFVLF